MIDRRFPPPWYVDDPDTKLGQDCFTVRDMPMGNGWRTRLCAWGQIREKFPT